jgi:hypothetical protein
MDLLQALDCVEDEKTFLIFVEVLRRDFEFDDEEWENHTIDAFLAAGQSWAENPKFGLRRSLVEASPWKKFAVFLYCGKIYQETGVELHSSLGAVAEKQD